MEKSKQTKSKSYGGPYPDYIYTPEGKAIQGSEALRYGNNVAWICPKCGRLNIARTYKSGRTVACIKSKNKREKCAAVYRLVSGLTESKKEEQGPIIRLILDSSK